MLERLLALAVGFGSFWQRCRTQPTQIRTQQVRLLQLSSGGHDVVPSVLMPECPSAVVAIIVDSLTR